MAKNRKLLRVGTPVRLSQLRTLLEAADTADPENTIVYHYNGELIVEEPVPTLEDADAGDDA